MWVTRALTLLAATGLPRADQIGLNAPVLLFTRGAALVVQTELRR